MELMNLFKAILLVQAFYSLAITGYAHVLPSDALTFLQPFQEGQSTDLQDMSSQVREGLEKQTSIPVIELGALVFYSGNLLIDLLLNFAFAIPQMLGMLVNGIMLLFSVDSYLFALVEIFASIIVGVMYFIAIIETLLSLRAGSRGVV